MPEIIEESELETITFSKNTETVVNKSRHYVDDEDLTRILSGWKVQYDAAKAQGVDVPSLPEAVGEAILDMTEQMGRRHNFSGYSYLDEMKSDATEHCCRYIHNFNPVKKSEKKGKVSAFGYINMIIWRSFTHRIEQEKREQYLKYKSFELMGGMDAFQDEDMASITGEEGESSGLSIGVLGADFIQKAREYEEKYELDKRRKKEKKEVAFDAFMFNLDIPKDDDTPEDIDLSLGEELDFE